MTEIKIGDRLIGDRYEPFVIAEIGINHEGDMGKALQMIDDAYDAGAECVKFQRHVLADEMTSAARKVIPGNAMESIWDIMERCALTLDNHRELKRYTESLGMIYLCTPFSRAAADELESIGVLAYKIGSGECNNYPLVEHIARFGKPVILSTGMNDINSIAPAVEILTGAGVEFAITHCTSMYPTPYDRVRLGSLHELSHAFPQAVLGLSDHSIGNYTCFASIPLGARILEKHFTSDKNWPGPDVPISIDPDELRELVFGARAIFQALGGQKEILADEKPVIDFAYASVVSTCKIEAGQEFSYENIWVKRPGTGQIPAAQFKGLLGKVAKRTIDEHSQITWDDIQ